MKQHEEVIKIMEENGGYTSFKDIRNRVSFIDYDFVANLHTKSFELLKIGQL